MGAQRLRGLAPRRTKEPELSKRRSEVRAAAETAGPLWFEDLEGELVGPPPAYVPVEDLLYPDLRLFVEDVNTGLESPMGEGAEGEAKGGDEAAPFSAPASREDAGVEKQDVRPSEESSCEDDEDQVKGRDGSAPRSASASKEDASVEKRKEKDDVKGRDGAADNSGIDKTFFLSEKFRRALQTKSGGSPTSTIHGRGV